MSEVNNQVAFKEFIKTIFYADDPILENWQPQAFAEYYSSLYKDFVNGYAEFIKTYYSQDLPERIEDEFYEYAKNLWDIQQAKLNTIEPIVKKLDEREQRIQQILLEAQVMVKENKPKPKTESTHLHQHAHEYLLKMIESGMLVDNPHNDVGSLPELAYKLAQNMNQIEKDIKHENFKKCLDWYDTMHHKHDDNQQQET